MFDKLWTEYHLAGIRNVTVKNVISHTPPHHQRPGDETGIKNTGLWENNKSQTVSQWTEDG